MRFGATEIVLILLLALVVFGSDKLKGVGKALGTSIREFKQEVKNPAEVNKNETGRVEDSGR